MGTTSVIVRASVYDTFSDSEEDSSEFSTYYSESSSSYRYSNRSNDDSNGDNSESTGPVSSFQPISLEEFSANNETSLELNNNGAFMNYFRKNLEKARREGHNAKNRKEILSMLLNELLTKYEI